MTRVYLCIEERKKPNAAGKWRNAWTDEKKDARALTNHAPEREYNEA